MKEKYLKTQTIIAELVNSESLLNNSLGVSTTVIIETGIDSDNNGHTDSYAKKNDIWSSDDE